MKTILALSILFSVMALPALGALTDADLDKIRLIVKEEIKEEIKSVKEEIKGVKEEIKSVKEEIKAEITIINSKIDGVRRSAAERGNRCCGITRTGHRRFCPKRLGARALCSRCFDCIYHRFTEKTTDGPTDRPRYCNCRKLNNLGPGLFSFRSIIGLSTFLNFLFQVRCGSKPHLQVLGVPNWTKKRRTKSP